MNKSIRFINFATAIGIFATLLGFSSCKGRTMENVEPTGDTIEVVIMQDSVA